jgi:hypothetical protein
VLAKSRQVKWDRWLNPAHIWLNIARSGEPPKSRGIWAQKGVGGLAAKHYKADGFHGSSIRFHDNLDLHP